MKTLTLLRNALVLTALFASQPSFALQVAPSVGGSLTVQRSTYIYSRPTLNNTAIDICARWGVDCGKPAADMYCRRKGHRESVAHEIGYDRPPTRLFSGQICNEAFCDRFTRISCVK